MQKEKLKVEPMPGFDALKFKEEAQARVQAELEGKSPEEEIQWLRERAETGPFADLVRRMRPPLAGPDQWARWREFECMREAHRQQMEIRNWWVTVVFTATAALFCIVGAFQTESPDLQRIALALLPALVAGWVGYAAGRASRKE
jgi:hypothetical protein